MKFFKDKIRSKYTAKRAKLHHFKKFSRGGMPPNHLAKCMASPCAACRLATCKFPNREKKFLAPPLPNPGYAPKHKYKNIKKFNENIVEKHISHFT